jgi:4-amino-4-deoxy-L-arabinose transferase-like glycosyltransferase
MQIRGIIFYILIACAAIELLLFCWLCFLGQEAFREFVSTPDTSTYASVALQLAENATLISSRRTLGYPLFLSLGYLIGGRSYGTYVVITTQLILNIVFTWGCWRLLQRITPAAGTRLRSIVTLFFFWAGMGMATYLLTDFLASFLFGVFLYGMLFWRSRSSVLLSGTSLALATLTRPTFIFIPFLLPFAAYLIGRFTSKVPRSHLVSFILFSFIATCISIIYQHTFNGYIGVSPIFTQTAEEFTYLLL